MELRGKVALVTGASRGIGRGIALALADEGADVALCGLHRDTAEALAQEIRARGQRALAFAVDVSQAAAVADMVQQTAAGLGGIDVLVNNAGAGSAGNLVDLTEEQWDRVMDVNAKGVFLACKYAIPPMLARGGGAIVNIASVAGRIGYPGIAHYSASKFAVIGLTQALAREVGRQGIRVNAVCPGHVPTDMLWETARAWGSTPQAFQEAEGVLPTPQSVEEIAQAVIFLARHDAITGQTLNVDGGVCFN
jgi:meso-butanediol dehydrogenase / (S,S)-butanediol dehydrogenase / diacetyl reductase